MFYLFYLFPYYTVVLHNVNCEIRIAGSVLAWLSLTVQFSVGGNYNSSFLHKSSPTTLDFTGLTNQTNYHNYTTKQTAEVIFISIEFPEQRMLQLSSDKALDIWMFLLSGECLESRCLVPGAWSVPVPGGTLLLPVNTGAREGVTWRERGGPRAH